MMCAVTVTWSVFSHLRHAVVLLLQDTWMSQVGAEVYHVNSTFFDRGSIRQGDNRFSDVSRGRQCAFMSLSALLCANSSDILTWITETIDGILIEGDVMYLKAFEERSIPDEETISLNYLPDRVLSS